MNINLTGKQRLWAVIAIAWILFWLFAIEPWESRFPYDKWKYFLVIGIGPIALTLTFIWVRRGLQSDRKEKERSIRELKQSVTCPKCQHQVHRQSLEQIEFKCSYCGEQFQYCPHCGSTYDAP